MRRVVGWVGVALVVVTGCASGPRPTVVAPETTTATTSAPTTVAGARSATPDSSSTTTTPSATGPCGRPGPAPARYDHVIWIWMENHTATSVLSSDKAPFERSLASSCGSSSSYRDVGSPSLPNYLGATSGSVHGVHDDGSPSVHPISGDNLFRQVVAAGGTARSYEEAMPSNCSLTSSGRYAVKHNPQAYYADPADRAACQRDDVPLGTLTAGAFADDLAHSTLATFSFITPDLCNDTHDCAVAVGDAWLQQWVGAVLSSPTYAAGRTALFVVWDEPTPMPLLVVAPHVAPGTASRAAFDHYALLHTTEELLGLAPTLGAAANAVSMRDAYGL
jgi:hypothetical protein